MRRDRWILTAKLLVLALLGCGSVDGGDGDGDGDGPDAGEAGSSALAALEVSTGVLSPAFDPEVTAYRLRLGLSAADLVVTATAATPDGADIEINDQPAESGVASAPLPLDLGDNTVRVVVTPDTLDGGEPRTYEIDVSRGAGTAQRAYVKASNPDAQDFFGDIAIDGDTLVVGAARESSAAVGVGGDQTDNSATNAGAVYVFVRDGASWSQQAYLKASNTEAADFFGGAVAISGDTIAVGATGEDSAATGVNNDQSSNGASGSGAVYVFVRDGASWSQQAYLKASNTGDSDFFGGALALDGDTLIVGAQREDSAAAQADNSASNAGAAYVFVRANGLWSQQAYVKAPNAEAVDSFGVSVAVSGDTLAVGALFEDSGATGTGGGSTARADNSAADAGAVYVFTRSGTNWSLQSYVKASNTGAGDRFGRAVDLDGDTLVVGAPFEDSGAVGVNGDEVDDSVSASGAVYVFERIGTTWSQRAYLKASNPDELDNFGDAVAVDGDVLIAGAAREDAAGGFSSQDNNDAEDAGAAYMFLRVAGQWTQQAYLKAAIAEPGDSFAEQVAISGNTVIISAPNEDSAASMIDGDAADNSASNAGAVYVLE